MHGKTIVLGIGGGIACYKIADLASKLTQNGADVHAVLTASAQKFIAPLTFQALTHNPALGSLWDDDLLSGKSSGMPHIALADAADLVLIAPATADLIARLAAGLSDDLLTTLVLATRAPIAIAPAMNPQMLAHAATQRNLEILRGFGTHIFEPNVGRMACEHVGSGRLPETAELLERITELLNPRREMDGKTVVVTAGPTRELLDPVRFISNRSSGKMGYAIAAEAAKRGATVVLISGPTSLETPRNVEKIEVLTTGDMYVATLQAFENADFLIAAAAPADFRAFHEQTQKIKRGTRKTLEVKLRANPDIVAQCGATKKSGQIVVGFAAETQNLEKEARRKLQLKNLDFVVANDVSQPDAGFESDSNRVLWVSPAASHHWPLMSKSEVAARIWDELKALPPL